MDTQTILHQLHTITGYKPERKGRVNWLCLCPVHSDTIPSLSVKAAGDRTLLHCFGCGASFQDLMYAITQGESVNYWTSAKQKAYTARRQESRFVCDYIYVDINGRWLYRKLRFEPKSFAQQKWDGKRWVGEWGALDGVPRVLYRLPAVAAADLVFIVEGEKSTDTLNTLLRGTNATATCNFDGGSKGGSKWLATYNPYLKNKHIAIIPDNDPAGKNHAQQVFMGIDVPVKSKKIIELPGLAIKDDPHDWVKLGYTLQDLRRIWASV